MKYDLAYREQTQLRDNTKIVLRAIRPDDKEALAAGHQELSEESRRSRFFAAKSRLSEEELKFFTEVDGQNHYALVAVREANGAEPEGIGVARFVRTDDPKTVETAIVVADEWQNRGVGTCLMHAIVEAAAERGYRHIKAITQEDNTRLRHLLAPYSRSVQMVEGDSDLLEIIIDIPRSGSSEAFQTLHALMRLVALGSLAVPVVIGHGALDLLSELLQLKRRAREK